LSCGFDSEHTNYSVTKITFPVTDNISDIQTYNLLVNSWTTYFQTHNYRVKRKTIMFEKEFPLTVGSNLALLWSWGYAYHWIIWIGELFDLRDKDGLSFMLMYIHIFRLLEFVAWYLVLCVVFVLVLLWSLHCMFFFDIRLLITTLASSNFFFYKCSCYQLYKTNDQDIILSLYVQSDKNLT
jgi:hypothetical protein